MSLSESFERFGTEAQCEAAFLGARWPGGFVGPDCDAREHSTFVADRRRYWRCATCRVRTTLCSGTLFHASKLPLTTWLQAIYLLTQSRNCLSALSLKHHLGVCYRTAWRVKHKLQEATAERESTRQLVEPMVADDGYLGGVHAGKPGRGSENKALLIAAVELNDDGCPQHVRFDPLPDLKEASVLAWATKALDPSVHLVTDGLATLGGAAALVAQYGAIIVSPRKSSALMPFCWVNTIISNLKTSISGTYHHSDFQKYRGSYLAGARYRVNRRFTLHSLVERLARTCAKTAPSPEIWLRLAEVRAG